jgi:hypothetical protein
LSTPFLITFQISVVDIPVYRVFSTTIPPLQKHLGMDDAQDDKPHPTPPPSQRRASAVRAAGVAVSIPLVGSDQTSAKPIRLRTEHSIRPNA